MKINKSKQKFRIRGGKPLKGKVKICGAKNSASKLLIASLLTDKQININNCPVSIGEIKIARQICELIGSKFKKFSEKQAIVQTKKIRNNSISRNLSFKNRISVLTIGPLLHRVGEALISKPGGDQIGARPINFHLDALKKLGVKIREYKDYFSIKANNLHGADIILPYPSVGATENIILTSTLAEGRTFIHNAAVEPEIVDLIKFLQKMGAIIDVLTNRTIVITGVSKLNSAEHSVIPDRLEAASFACAAIATGGEVDIINARQDDMISFLNSVRLVGADYEIHDEGIIFYRNGNLKPICLETDVHPGFMTDWQPPFTVMMTQANGVSLIHETVYENRFGYVKELKRMGAEIELFNQCLGNSECRYKNTNYYHSAVVKGPSELQSATINVPDIRAGFSYLIASLISKGESLVSGIEHIDRGYENIDVKLKGLGADIKRY